MTPETATPPMTSAAPVLSLEQFWECLRSQNPFVEDRVTQPALAAETDAETVHQTQFRQLLDLARMTRTQHHGVGVVLWGEAGVGKSHLLSRLARWAHRDEQACFVYLANLQSAPESLPRSLLRATVSILTRGRQGQFHETPLYRLVEAAVQTALQESAQTLEPERAYSRLLDRLGSQAPSQPALVDRTIYNVLFRFLRSAAQALTEADDGLAALAVRWLSGDPLDPTEAGQLGLPPQPQRDDAVALVDDQQIKLVLVALSQMALFAHKPLLLCFDQVENVENDQISALTRFLQAVLDSAPNLLVVTCGVVTTLTRWHEEGVIHDATWDRVTQFEILLQRVTPHESRQIVEARLHHHLTPFMELPEVKDLVQEDHLFPLGMTWFEETFKDQIAVRPRDVIKWARAGWNRVQQALKDMGGPRWLATRTKENSPGKKEPRKDPTSGTPRTVEALIDDKIRAKLEEQKNLRQCDPETLPPDGDNLSGLASTLLQQCLQGARPYALTGVPPLAARSSRQRPTYHLIVNQRHGSEEVSIGVLFLTTGNATASAAALRRLLDNRKPPSRLLLVTDERRPLRLGPKGQEYLDQLRRKNPDGFQQIQLTFAQYADLDALKATAGMARSQDLEIDLPNGQTRQVTEQEVVASHHRCDRYAAHVLLRPLLGKLDEFLPPPKESGNKADTSTPAPLPSEEQDVRQFITAQLALIPGASSHELVIKYLDYRKITKRPPLDPLACKALLEAVARGLHETGHVQVTPTADGLFLLPRKK